ncbi:MAG: amidohydrolase family protein [Burkholderiales bacterium]|nr:MAG: amidohydrolase family protein [Burkholderiales bacterium]
MKSMRLALVFLGTLLLAWSTRGAEPLPLFDAHLHYNVEAREPFPLPRVLELFREQRISGILANSRPNEGTRALFEAAPKSLWVVPFIRPYVVRPDRYTWFGDPAIYALIEQEFARGGYQGIGEFHLFGEDAASPWVKKMVDFAVRHDLYLHAHSDAEAVELLFAHDPRVKIIWAHSGFTAAPEVIARYFEKYPKLWGELSYRDEIAAGGRLRPEWKKLFERYPDRFLLGSDTWVNERWEDYARIMNGYREWLAELPREIAEKIAFGNALRLFRKTRN